VAVLKDPVGGSGLTAVANPWINGNSVSFNGTFANGVSGVYTNIGGKLQVVADTSKDYTIPGTKTPFFQFLQSSLSSDKTSFLATDSDLKRGIYTNSTGKLTTVVDTSFTNPNAKLGGNFDVIGPPTMQGNQIAFQSTFSEGGGKGEYLVTIGAKPTTIADTLTDIPVKGKLKQGSLGKFTLSGDSSLDGGNVAFQGYGNADFSYQGIFEWIGATKKLINVVDLNDTLPGQPAGSTIASFNFSRQGLSGNQLVFYADFVKDDKLVGQGIYLATVPEPSTLVLAGLAFAMVLTCQAVGRRVERVGRHSGS
jgi:hypothetical protein